MRAGITNSRDAEGHECERRYLWWLTGVADRFGGGHCEQDGYTRSLGDGRHSERGLHQSG